MTSVWLGGEFEVEGVESWRSFQSRVRAAIKRITSAEGRGRRVAVFTSGRVIGLAVQNVLNAPERSALEINWRVRNCSLTEFTFSATGCRSIRSTRYRIWTIRLCRPIGDGYSAARNY